MSIHVASRSVMRSGAKVRLGLVGVTAVTPSPAQPGERVVHHILSALGGPVTQHNLSQPGQPERVFDIQRGYSRGGVPRIAPAVPRRACGEQVHDTETPSGASRCFTPVTFLLGHGQQDWAAAVTLVSPGFTNTEGIGKGGSAETAAALIAQRDAIAMPPEAIARAVAFAIEQPGNVDVGEIVVRPTAQG
jgi:hypothetical protein